MHCGVPIAAEGRSRAPEKSSIAKSLRLGTISSSRPEPFAWHDVRPTGATRRAISVPHYRKGAGEHLRRHSTMLKHKHLSHGSEVAREHRFTFCARYCKLYPL